jgi:protocatechuate 3,4-dioxygenase beta subunit
VTTQADINREIVAGQESGQDHQPRLDYPAYRSSILRHPTKALHPADPEGVELWAPCFGHSDVDDAEADLTIQHSGEPQGSRITVSGRVLDAAPAGGDLASERGRPLRAPA